MKIKTRYIIAISILIGIVALMMIGYKIPPKKLNSTDVSIIHSVLVNNQEIIRLTKDEIEDWKELGFTIVSSEYPGETPDFVIDLIGEKNEFTAIYNKGSDIIFFSFVPEIEYGFLNSPPSGGWTKPLYKTKVTDELLKLLKIK